MSATIHYSYHDSGSGAPDDLETQVLNVNDCPTPACLVPLGSSESLLGSAIESPAAETLRDQYQNRSDLEPTRTLCPAPEPDTCPAPEPATALPDPRPSKPEPTEETEPEAGLLPASACIMHAYTHERMPYRSHTGKHELDHLSLRLYICGLPQICRIPTWLLHAVYSCCD